MDPYELLAGILVSRTPSTPVGGRLEWLGLVALAQNEGIGPLLHQALRAHPELEAAAAAREELASIYRDAVHASLCQEAVRRCLCRCLAERAIPVLLLKGAALAITCYADPATRPMDDLDLLVPPSHVEAAAGCLEANGFLPGFGSLAAGRRSPRGHLLYIHQISGVPVELHWELKLLGRTQRRAVGEVWDGARPAAAEGSPLVMRLGHTLPLLCAHMLLQHRQPRLLWLYDLHRVLLTMEATEAKLARDAAIRWRLGPCTGLALSRVREMFGTPLPEELDDWEMASRRDLQARVAAQALTPWAAETPSEYLISLLMNRNYSRRGILFPTPDDLRQRLHMAPGERVGPGAYAAFLSRRLRNGPLHLRQLWRFWRAAPRPPRNETTSPLSGDAARQEPE